MSHPLSDHDLANVPLSAWRSTPRWRPSKSSRASSGIPTPSIADGIESSADIVTSLVVWGGLRIATRPHPATPLRLRKGRNTRRSGRGHAASSLAAGVIAFQSVHEILTPHHLPHWSTLLVLALVVTIREALARWVMAAGEGTESTALEGDAWHHRADALTSLAAFIGISISLIGGPGYEPADDWAALLACLVIGWNGIALLRRALRDLLDVSPSPLIVDDIRALAGQVDGVRGVEKCRVRKSGTNSFVEIHVQVDGHLTVHEGHVIGGKVRRALRESPHRIADAIVHIEPYSEPQRLT